MTRLSARAIAAGVATLAMAALSTACAVPAPSLTSPATAVRGAIGVGGRVAVAGTAFDRGLAWLVVLLPVAGPVGPPHRYRDGYGAARRWTFRERFPGRDKPRVPRRERHRLGGRPERREPSRRAGR